MKTLIDLAIPAITFLLLTAVGLDLTPADFDRVRRRPGIVAVGLALPLLLLPPLAIALVRLFQPSPGVEAGLLLIAACPIGGISNTYSYLARASTALSVTLTGISCFAAVLTIPLLTVVFEWAMGHRLAFSPPVGTLTAQLAFMLALPVGLGMFLKRRWPLFADDHRAAFQHIGFGALALLIVLVIVNQADLFRDQLAETALLAILFVVASMGMGWAAGGLTQASRADRFTLAVEFSTRNAAIATAIAVTVIGEVRFAVFATTYFLVEMPLMLAAVAVFRARTRPDSNRPRGDA